MELKYVIIAVIIGLGCATWCTIEIIKLINEIKRRKRAKVSVMSDNDTKKEVKK